MKNFFVNESEPRVEKHVIHETRPKERKAVLCLGLLSFIVDFGGKFVAYQLLILCDIVIVF